MYVSNYVSSRLIIIQINPHSTRVVARDLDFCIWLPDEGLSSLFLGIVIQDMYCNLINLRITTMETIKYHVIV